jgi:LysM repeat protein
VLAGTTVVSALSLLLAAPAAGAADYRVEPGDTLSGIAARHSTTVGDLLALNGLSNPHRIVAGRVLELPDPVAAPVAGRAPTTTGAPGNRHVVQAGETLGEIAARYGLPATTLAEWNGLTRADVVYAGASLVLYRPNTVSAAPLTAVRCPVPGARFTNDWGFPRAMGRVHSGNDLFAPRGTAVRAPVSGTVTNVRGSIGGNQFRLTDAAGNQWVGSHLDRFGATGSVGAGDVIGYVGDTGNAVGSRPHLHLQYHPGGGAAVNPYPLVRPAC